MCDQHRDRLRRVLPQHSASLLTTQSEDFVSWAPMLGTQDPLLSGSQATSQSSCCTQPQIPLTRGPPAPKLPPGEAEAGGAGEEGAGRKRRRQAGDGPKEGRLYSCHQEPSCKSHCCATPSTLWPPLLSFQGLSYSQRLYITGLCPLWSQPSETEWAQDHCSPGRHGVGPCQL